MSPLVVDSHMHVWDLERGDYAWLGPEHGELYRTFGPAEAETALRDAGISAAVLVQAEDSLADTEWMLEVAESWEFVVGVVGWVQLDDPDVAGRQLDHLARHPSFCGVRHLVHDDPRDDFLELPAVRRSLRLLARVGLPMDVPDAWPHHLLRLPELADAEPALTLVIDHLGKPPRGSVEMADWTAALRSVARRPNTVAKLSGLQVPGQPFTVESLRTVWETALATFGPSRLMFGGDWPMTVPGGGYLAHWDPVRTLVEELTPQEQSQVMSGTAVQTYRLPLAGAHGTARPLTGPEV